MTEVMLGLFSGIAFGFVIQRAGATSADEMARAHLMMNGRIPMFMVSTVAIAALGLAGMQAVGVGRISVLPTSIVATGLGAVIFGVGWGISGYCPGTCWAAAGEGRMDAIFALLGGLAGTAVFAQLHETLIPLLYGPTNIGRLSLADWLGRPLGAFVLAIALGVAVAVINRVWRGATT